jgi:hypothetical protein
LLSLLPAVQRAGLMMTVPALAMADLSLMAALVTCLALTDLHRVVIVPLPGHRVVPSW